MSNVYFLRYKNIIIGEFSLDGQKYTPTVEAEKLGDAGYPFGLYKLIHASSGELYIDRDKQPSQEDIKLWLSDRVFPKERQGANQILESLGLTTYDSWEIAKKTNAISLNDFYWMSNRMEDSFENINVYHASVEHFNSLAAQSTLQDPIKKTKDFEDFEEPREELATK
ncbi:hypothetical protein [Paenibacillus xylanexedens]|uniref:Uncharacterized protein n=1 Tax=Paenibacillus xylanexedens TaxID=528191 RepID=A0ABS4RXA8_PAEXY|nr:hypothetical protein [Paenibacillus xylanexedens]MBP2247527.1 hypothetical protein [Paenibacillus xylanexedens]